MGIEQTAFSVDAQPEVVTTERPRSRLKKLVARWEAEEINGRAVMVQGPPGYGKTHFVDSILNTLPNAILIQYRDDLMHVKIHAPGQHEQQLRFPGEDIERLREILDSTSETRRAVLIDGMSELPRKEQMSIGQIFGTKISNPNHKSLIMLLGRSVPSLAPSLESKFETVVLDALSISETAEQLGVGNDVAELIFRFTQGVPLLNRRVAELLNRENPVEYLLQNAAGVYDELGDLILAQSEILHDTKIGNLFEALCSLNRFDREQMVIVCKRFFPEITIPDFLSQQNLFLALQRTGYTLGDGLDITILPAVRTILQNRLFARSPERVLLLHEHARDHIVSLPGSNHLPREIVQDLEHHNRMIGLITSHLNPPSAEEETTGFQPQDTTSKGDRRKSRRKAIRDGEVDVKSLMPLELLKRRLESGESVDPDTIKRIIHEDAIASYGQLLQRSIDAKNTSVEKAVRTLNLRDFMSMYAPAISRDLGLHLSDLNILSGDTPNKDDLFYAYTAYFVSSVAVAAGLEATVVVAFLRDFIPEILYEKVGLANNVDNLGQIVSVVEPQLSKTDKPVLRPLFEVPADIPPIDSMQQMFNLAGYFKQASPAENVLLTQDLERALLLGLESEPYRQELLFRNLRMVLDIVFKYKGLVPDVSLLQDLYGSGVIGALRAIDTYDWRHGSQYSSYFMKYVKVDMYGEVLRNRQILMRREARYAYHTLKQRIIAEATALGLPFTSVEMALEKLVRYTAERMNEVQATVAVEEAVAQLLGNGKYSFTRISNLIRLVDPIVAENSSVSFDQNVDASGESQTTFAEIIPDATAHDFTEMDHIFGPRLTQALEALTNRERDILLRRIQPSGERDTLEAIGKEYGIKRERVRQIEVTALRKLQFAFRKLTKQD